MGIRNTAIPYMGNIQREVFPFKRLSEPFIFDVAVNMISRHQPTVPHSMNFFIIWIVWVSFWEIYLFFIKIFLMMFLKEIVKIKNKILLKNDVKNAYPVCTQDRRCP